MAVILPRVDAAALANTNFTFEFNQWVSVLVDTLNELIQQVEGSLNFPNASYTAIEIAAFETAGTLVDGVVLYDTTNNVYVGRQSGVLVSFTTGVYP
ncbi:hypothetical protein [Thiocapsa sp. N5-Cardenillas]|uniref:hypothetical protein n=1 Tax=Thiocapsa sp. N5-Cardenillas TaxID=3137397 RepID=UPI0035AE774A